MDLYEEVYRALIDLSVAIKEMYGSTFPKISFPQIKKRFEFSEDVVWYVQDEFVVCAYFNSYYLLSDSDVEKLARKIVDVLKGKPSKVAKVVSRIKKARAFCFAIATKRKRMAQKTLLLQTKKEIRN